ncbi:major facilitator superfamily domain-containing protein 1 isoform X1 [Danio aesculapii]|uniref:major facilitator superfamily domain-containing protein 1 isoform X1 n=2 Tax=Danio aesculapii TaxID=1142201 RepID=UPI0024BFB198|nr:major facilitator superfamily domain-containing protein 1 isoform X1 [Danio aesculapii]
MADREEHQNLLDEDKDEDGDDKGRSVHLNPLCDPNHLLHRIVVLIFMCFLGFGSYFCYDNPAALQSQVIQDMNLNTASFMQLYAWYSWPNVVLCFLGGFLLDRVFGIRLGTVIFSLFVLVGQIIFAAGALANHFWLMNVGRFVFGIGGESLAVAQNTYAVNWFKGKELNLVFGLQLSMARLGSTVNMNVIGWVYARIQMTMGSAGPTTLGITLMIAASTCLFSLICALVLGFLDKRAERILNKEQGKTGEVIKLTDVKDFSVSLWLIFIICVAYYVAIFPFIGLGQVFFIEKFGFTPVQARAINSVVYIISAPASPLLGFLVDKTGRNVMWVLLAVITTLLSHMMLAFTFWNPWIAMSLLGVSYSLLACALWPMVAFVVPEHQLGTAYGFMQSIQNLGLAVMSIAAGSILDVRGYLFLEVFFIACLCMALLAVVLLYLFDYYKEGGLNLSAATRSKRAKPEDVQRLHAPRQSVGDRDHLKPLSPFGVRNRYLSRLGVQMPGHCCPHLSSLAYRSLLK